MANTIPPPLPPPPPRLQLPPSVNSPAAVAAPAPAATAAAAATATAAKAELKKPYITIKNLTTVVDASIGRHVDDLDERIALKELPVIGPSGTSKSTAPPKFERTQGDHPDLKVDIYEQMVYHRAKSTNKNLLEIFVPSRYKINYDKIKQYFATKGTDKDVDDLKKTVISAYGNNYNSLFYKHTIAGKTAPAAARTGSSSGGDLDKLAMESIQNKIDRWHFNYAEWSFYDNASSFFVQKMMLPKDELLTLKMDFDDVFGGAGAGAGAGGLITIVYEISRNYTGLKEKYTANIEDQVIVTPSSTLDNYNKLFKILYGEIDKRKTEPLDYVTERQRDFPSYTFDVNTRIYLLRAFERLHNISQQMTTVYNTFGDTPINSKIKLLETLNDEYTQLIQGIERDANLKNANDIFTKYMLGPNKKYDGKFIPNYKIIQYVFWLIRGGGAAAGGASFVNNAFDVDYADVNPEDLYGLIQDLPAGLTTEEETKKTQFMKDEVMIEKLEDINKLIAYRNTNPAFITIKPNNYEVLNRYTIAWPVTVELQRGYITAAINKELAEVRLQNIRIENFVANTATANKGQEKFEELNSKIRELKGKHFASMLIFYNYLEAKKADNIADIAEFFNTFYEESKLMNPEIDSHSSIVGDNPKTVPTFSFGIDILFWTLLRITKYYSGMHINFIKTMKEKIGPENPELRNLRLEIGVKESKLKHICELIANTGNISIDAIIPDRAGYYIKDVATAATGGGLYSGFVDPDAYLAEWRKKIDPAGGGGETANDIIKTTNKMKKKLDESLGTTQGDLSEMLSTLIELNTIQVVNMLFARPRNIWYSPDLRIKPNPDESSKWILFQLDKTKIISGRAFSKFQKELKAPVDDAGVGGVGVSRLRRILDKNSTKPVPPIIFTALDQAEATPFLIFIIATQPFPPRMLDKDNLKDAADVMFDDPSFAPAADAAAGAAAAGAVGGIIENGSDIKGAMANTIDKIKGKILPTKESCATGKDAILNAATDLNDSFNKTLRSIGVDLERKVDKFLQKPPPPPPPSMIPPPLPPPPPSAAALATHQAGQQAAAAAAAQQAAAAAAAAAAALAAQQAALAAATAAQQAIANARATAQQAITNANTVLQLSRIQSLQSVNVITLAATRGVRLTSAALLGLAQDARDSARAAETQSRAALVALTAAQAASNAAAAAQIAPPDHQLQLLQLQLLQLNADLPRESQLLTQHSDDLNYHNYNLRHEELKLRLATIQTLPPNQRDFQHLIQDANALQGEVVAYNGIVIVGVVHNPQLAALANTGIPATIQQIIDARQAATAAAAALKLQGFFRKKAAAAAAAATAATAAAALAAQQAAEQTQIDLLATIRPCINETFTLLKIQHQLPAAPQAVGITSAILRVHIVNCLDILVTTNERSIVVNLLNEEGIQKEVDDRITRLGGLLREITDLSNCNTPAFQIKQQALIAAINERIGTLRGAITDMIIPTQTGIITKLYLDIQPHLVELKGSNPIKPPSPNNVCNILRDSTRRFVSPTYKNEILATLDKIMGDTGDSCNKLKDEYAQCMDGQTAALTAALAYLQELNTTCATLTLPSPHQSPNTLADANTQISECLNALMGYLDENTFLNPMVSNTLTELQKAFIATELSQKLVSQLADKVMMDQCKNKTITDAIKSDMTSLIARVTRDVQGLAANISGGNITGPFKQQILDVRTSLRAEEQALRNINLTTDYRLPKPSSKFLKQIGDIRANLPPELIDDFNQKTARLRTEINAFVRDSFNKISQCRQDESTAAAERAAKDAQDRKLGEYLQALRQVSPGILPPPALGERVEVKSVEVKSVEVKINSELNLLLSKLNTDINEKTQLANQSKQTIDGLIALIGPKTDELRKFIDNRLDICNDPTIVAKNKSSLNAIISELNTATITLTTLSLEIARTLPELETKRNAIIAKIQTEITKCNSPATLAALDHPTITAIGKEMNGLKKGYDELNQKSAGKLTDVAAIYKRNDAAATTMKQEIEDCIQTRKKVATAWQNRAVDSIATMNPIASKCKARIGALCQMADSGAINQVDATNPAKVGLTGRLVALRQACSAYNDRLHKIIPSLYDVPPTASSIEKNLEDILVYQQGLNDPAIGLAQLKTQYDKALASVNTLAAHKDAIEQMFTELTRYEGEIDAIKTDIGSVIAAQEEAASAAADINVFDELKTRPFSGVSFNERTGDLILSFGNAQQPLNVSGKELSRQPPSSPGKSGDGEADEASVPVSGGPPGVGRRRLAAANGPYSIVITPTSQFYKKLIFGKVPQDIWLREIELADLKAEFGVKKVNLIEGAEASPKIDPADKLAIAKAAAMNPIVVKSLLASVGISSPFLLEQYDILVRLCDNVSAAGVINELLIHKNVIKPTPAPGAAGFGLGLVIQKMPDTGEMKIIRMNGSGGAAASRQVRIDDIILEGDGKKLTTLSEEQVSAALAGPAGSECVLRLKRRNGPGPEIFTVKVRRIPPLPVKNEKGSTANVSDILQKLGWNGDTNTVWYNEFMNKTGASRQLQGGLFSLFSFKNRTISQFLHTNCATDYVCMLNWIFLIALRLNNGEPKTFIPVNIQELLKNTYNSVYGFVVSEQPFQTFFIATSPPTNIYIDRVNGNLVKTIFQDATLTPIVNKIKEELSRNLDDSLPFPSSQPGSASSSRSSSPLPTKTQQQPQPLPKRPGGAVTGPPVLMGGGHKKKTRRINRKIDGGHHTIKKHSQRESERGEKWTRRRHHKLRAKRILDRIKTRRPAPVYFSA